MTTFSFKDNTYTIVYIDPSAASAGTGETVASPLTDFPSSLSNNTCYLVRRTAIASKCQIPVGEYTSIQNIWFMGMPKEEDVLEWSLIDSDAKTAWGSDSATYANMLIQPSTYGGSYSYSVHISDARDVRCHRAYFFRDENGPSAGDYCNPLFACRNSSYPDFVFKHCKFSYLGVDLEDSTYLANNNSMPMDTSTYPQWKMCNYIYLYTANRFEFDNCVINYRKRNSSRDNQWRVQTGFFVENYVTEFVCNNSQFNLLSCGNQSDEYNYRGGDYNSCFYVSYNPSQLNCIQNTTINYIYGSTDWQLPYFCYFNSTNQCDRLFFKNITYNVKKMKDVVPVPNSSYNMYSDEKGIRVYGYKQYEIDNYIVNFNDTGLGIPYCRMLTCENFFRQCPGPANKTVKNIKMTYCQEKTNLVCDSRISEGSDIYAFYFSGEWGYTSSDSSETTTDWRTGSSYDSPLIQKININCPWGASAYFDHVTVIEATLRGRLQLAYGAGVECNSLYNNYGATYGIYITDKFNYLRVKSYTVNKNNSLSKYTGNQNQLVCRSGDRTTYTMNGNNVYIDSSNAPMFDLQMATANREFNKFCTFICPNMGATGQYYQRNQQLYVQSWNVQRTGSTAVASYKFVGNDSTFGQYDNDYDIVLGMRPYNGFQFTPSQTGNATITFYIAVKDEAETVVSNSTLHEHFHIEADVPHLVETVTGGTDIYNNTLVSSLYDGVIETDTSTWSDNTIVAKKIVLPINIETTAKPINIRVYYGWYDLDGYCYLDPAFNVAYAS